MAQVIIGVDPHNRSATIEIINDREQVLGRGRFATDRDGYKAMLAAGRKHPDRLWAVEGSGSASAPTPQSKRRNVLGRCSRKGRSTSSTSLARSTPSQSGDRRWDRTGSRKSSPRRRTAPGRCSTRARASVDLPEPPYPETLLVRMV
jgi:hypothetical protein